MKLLITGASGFIGQHLVKKLIEQGHTILALSRSADLQHVTNNTDKLIYFQSSLELENSALERIKDFEPDVLIHLAWGKIPDFSFETSFENLQNHILFFRNIFTINSLKKIIVTGSCWEYNKKMGGCKESDICVSGNFFTWAKNSLRDFLQYECLQKNVNFIWTRVFYVYGPQQRIGSLIPSVIENIRKGLIPELKTPSNANDFIYVDDVAEGLLQFAINDITSGIYNLGSGKSMPVIDLVCLIENSLNGNMILSKELLIRTTLSNKHTDFWADMTKTFSAIKWKPRTSLALGIEKMINYKKK
jgi:nucleoside-diphosphate-sugar epimerase